MKKLIPILLAAAALAACQTPVYYPAPQPRPAPRSPTPQPAPAPEETAPQPVPQPARPPAKQFRLGTASTALVAQARSQSAAGEHGLAAATLERALRIEPDNPLLWIELGEVRQAEGNHAQADSMGRKAIALAAGDPRAQSAAWRLIAESLRARRRNAEAREAEQRADALLPR